MKIGVPKEIKTHEYRVGLTPPSVRELIVRGHEVFIETKAGEGIGCPDSDYTAAGAKILPTAAEVFKTADMIVKVKEPQPKECEMLREGQILFTYLHLAADKQQAEGLMKSKCVAIAYETVTDAEGRLPLLAPMSEVAGRMAVQVGARYLEKEQGGAGILLGGVPGVQAAKVVVLGGGVVGTNSIRMAIGLGARVTVVDRSIKRLNELDMQFGSRLTTIYSTADNIEEQVRTAHLVIGGVLIPGAAAPRLVTKKMVENMIPGSVLVDVAIDQGGCFETSRPTTHSDPVYKVNDVIHYCVTNMPGGVPRTSAFALNNATLPFVTAIAQKGWRKALSDNPHLANGLNVCLGEITFEAVAKDLGLKYAPTEKLLAA
ncbi:MAG: alanine dehydrogenase [Alphaproteobacteria bacterium]|nr:MAG: alanine dehydrogenase [Alphaproteobacteria bacterium]